MSNMTRRALYMALSQLKSQREDGLNKLVPFVEPILTIMHGKVFDPELLAKGAQKLVAGASIATSPKPSEDGPPGATIRNASDHLFAGLLFDDAGHRMVPTHATRGGIHYRYYVSLPLLHGESKTAAAGSVTRISAADIESTIIKSLNEFLVTQKERPSSSTQVADRKLVLDKAAIQTVTADPSGPRSSSR